MSKDYVAYHNVEKMGRTLQEGDPLQVVSNKSLKNLVEVKVWMIVGEKVQDSTKKRFTLGSAFTVNDVGDLADDQFKHYARGSGQVFDPPIVVSDEPWFEDFRKNARSFEGICPIKDESHIAALEQLTNERTDHDSNVARS